MFFDARLSRAGTQSCATCHSPQYYYAAQNQIDGARAIPSLRYVDRVPTFAIGVQADDADADASAGGGASLAASPTAVVPRGGLFWDGRAATLQSQTLGPLFNPAEMGNSDTLKVSARLRSWYGSRLARLFGKETIADPHRLLDEAMFAVARFEQEEPSFHPYSSKYDAVLRGSATLDAAEARGRGIFENANRGNCASCHPSRPTPEGQPPAFSDYEYEALGVPRNAELAANRDAAHYDLGLCDRPDLHEQKAYCGMFRTPSLRNVATRHAFFHNGVYHSLRQVVEFYALRDSDPERIYPTDANGVVRKFDDLPGQFHSNVDTVDAPFNRQRGHAPALTPQEIDDVIAFLRTLTDGYPGTETQDR